MMTNALAYQSGHQAFHLLARDTQLAAVKVSKADVDIIAAEFELDPKLADRRLREHRGNLLEALQSFL